MYYVKPSRTALTVFLLLLLIIAFILAIPFIDGYLYKQEYLRVMTGLTDKYSDKNTKFEIQYTMGWLHSHAKIRIISTDPQLAGMMADGFIISDEITHGPFVYDTAAQQYTFAAANIVSRTYLPGNLQRALIPSKQATPVIEVNILAHFDNTWISRIKVTALTIPFVGAVQFGDSTMTLTFTEKNNQISQYSLKSNVGNMSFRSSNPALPSVDVQPSQHTYNATRQTADFWSSSSSQSIPGFNVTWADASKLSVNAINAKTEDNLNNKNLYQLNSMLTIKSINSPYFIITDFSDVKGSLIIKDINYAGVEAYNASVTMDPNAAIASASKIFTPTSSINFALSFNSNLGAFISSLKFGVKPQADFSDAQLLNLASKLEMSSDIKINEKLFLQLVIKYIEKMDSYTDQLMPGSAPTTSSAQTPSDPARDLVGNLYRDGKITLQQSLDLFGLISEKPDATVFSQKVTGITPDHAAELIQAYQASLASAQTQAQADVTLPSPANRESRAAAMIASWEQQGYLIREGSDFIIHVTFAENGIQINGKDLSSATTPAAAPTTIQPIAPMPVPVPVPAPAPTAAPVTAPATVPTPAPMTPTTPQPLPQTPSQ